MANSQILRFNIKAMHQYKIKFCNTYEFAIYAVSRKEAISKAIETTRGLLTVKQQKINLEYCNLKTKKK